MLRAQLEITKILKPHCSLRLEIFQNKKGLNVAGRAGDRETEDKTKNRNPPKNPHPWSSFKDELRIVTMYQYRILIYAKYCNAASKPWLAHTVWPVCWGWYPKEKLSMAPKALQKFLLTWETNCGTLPRKCHPGHMVNHQLGKLKCRR